MFIREKGILGATLGEFKSLIAFILWGVIIVVNRSVIGKYIVQSR